MPKRTTLPATASVADTGLDGRMTAPAATRNMLAIQQALLEHAPRTGRALELASGTGQHVAALADALPGLTWHPSEVDPARCISIDAWSRGKTNIAPAIFLDATSPGWGPMHAGQDLILLVNLLHLISTAEAHTLIREAAAALAPNGTFAIYGPFLRDGQTISQGDATFHASLQAADPTIGYKDIQTVQTWMTQAGLVPLPPIQMPANNLMVIARRG
jgi:SAM-dependent methyltransferase